LDQVGNPNYLRKVAWWVGIFFLPNYYGRRGETKGILRLSWRKFRERVFG